MRSSILIAVSALWVSAFPQNLLPTYPNYQRYSSLRSQIPGSIVRPISRYVWSQDGKSVAFQRSGSWVQLDIASKKEKPLDGAPEGNAGTSGVGGRRGGVERGRQFGVAHSSDGKLKATYRNRNVYLSNADGSNEVAVTVAGNAEQRLKFGIASWVYGEELSVREALWFSPDSKKLAFYGFDESKVRDFYLTLSHVGIHTTLDVEPYPKAGTDNPIADLFIYDLATKTTLRVDVRDGKPFANDVIGHYVYEVRWSPDGTELLFNRTNRRQNIMELTAANPATGKCRVIIREEWLPSWTENAPTIQWLDSKRFIWASERTGFRNFYLYDISGRLISTLTKHAFDCGSILKVDEKAGVMFYTARSGDNPYLMQAHRVKLDGTGDKRMTDPKFHHTVNIAPDGKHLVDTFERHDVPPSVQLLDWDGRVLSEIAKSDDSKFNQLGLKKAEMFTFTAADGKTQLYGILMKPSDFDPSKKYPLLVSVYAGPESGMVRGSFITPDVTTELGFLVAFFDGRGTSGRGKRFKDELYLKLGVTEVDDQAAGVSSLAQRPYVDGSRVGIHGTSYGGYAAVMCLLRHPDKFAAACGSSSVTDWRHYDTIYTERYMWIPQENAEGYDAGSAMRYARNLKGRLMLFYGTADNNVHPSNTLQLISALQAARKNFEVQVGPDVGHAGLNQDRMLEFFIQSLILWRQ